MRLLPEKEALNPALCGNVPNYSLTASFSDKAYSEGEARKAGIEKKRPPLSTFRFPKRQCIVEAVPTRVPISIP
jgi:hypothetical protein